MKYEFTILHVIQDGINDECLLQFSYNPEKDEIKLHSLKGRLFILHGVSFDSIIRVAMMQENYVRTLDGELDKEVTQEDNHIYLNIADYAQYFGLNDDYFVENISIPNKELKTR